MLDDRVLPESPPGGDHGLALSSRLRPRDVRRRETEVVGQCGVLGAQRLVLLDPGVERRCGRDDGLHRGDVALLVLVELILHRPQRALDPEPPPFRDGLQLRGALGLALGLEPREPLGLELTLGRRAQLAFQLGDLAVVLSRGTDRVVDFLRTAHRSSLVVDLWWHPSTAGGGHRTRLRSHRPPGAASRGECPSPGSTRPRSAAATPAQCSASLPQAPLLVWRSEEHTSELQSLAYLVCRLLLEKKK